MVNPSSIRWPRRICPTGGVRARCNLARVGPFGLNVMPSGALPKLRVVGMAVLAIAGTMAVLFKLPQRVGGDRWTASVTDHARFDDVVTGEEPSEAAGDTTASPVASDQGESDSGSQGADAPGEDDVDAASADAGSDVPPSQTAGQSHEESSIGEADAPASLDEQDLVHQADARP